MLLSSSSPPLSHLCPPIHHHWLNQSIDSADQYRHEVNCRAGCAGCVLVLWLHLYLTSSSLIPVWTYSIKLQCVFNRQTHTGVMPESCANTQRTPEQAFCQNNECVLLQTFWIVNQFKCRCMCLRSGNIYWWAYLGCTPQANSRTLWGEASQRSHWFCMFYPSHPTLCMPHITVSHFANQSCSFID